MRFSENPELLLFFIDTTRLYKVFGIKEVGLTTKNFVVDGCKICPKCGENKPVSEYHFTPKKMSSYCKVCHRGVTRANYDKTKEVQQSQALMRLCGITLEQRRVLFEVQGKQCAICGISGDGVMWDTDHDHVTEKFRGVLCKPCNRMLGCCKDNIAVLVKAVEYLQPSDVIEVI